MTDYSTSVDFIAEFVGISILAVHIPFLTENKSVKSTKTVMRVWVMWVDLCIDKLSKNLK